MVDEAWLHFSLACFLWEIEIRDSVFNLNSVFNFNFLKKKQYVYILYIISYIYKEKLPTRKPTTH